MKIIVGDSYQSMCRLAVTDVIEKMGLYQSPLLCPASGDTTLGFFKELVYRHAAEKLNFSSWLYIGLDEWIGLNKTDEGSCHNALDNQLFQPLMVEENNICFFDGRAADAENECTRIETFINRHGAIDVAVLGLGMNGHTGMNEPGTSPLVRSHVSMLDAQTQEVSKKYFKDQRSVSAGITLGMATLLEARHIFLLVNGSHKADIVKKVIEGNITDAVPASLLRTHANLYIYLDADAAALLQTN